MLTAPALRGGVVVRAAYLVFGLLLFASGIVLLLEADLGLSPWDVLNQGISEHTPLSFGTANIVVALAVLFVARLLGARIGPGTVANAVLIGLFIDGLLEIDAVAGLSDAALPGRIAMLTAGIGVVGLASAFYIGANMGAGPRDSLMLVIAYRTGTRVGVVRTALEAAVTLVGFGLGGTVGIGTLVFALGIGSAIEAAFWLVQRTPLADGEVASAA
jgi:uncharacterized membrane protein YczE